MTIKNELSAGYALPAYLLGSKAELDEAVAKAKRTRAAVDDAAGQIPALEAEIKQLADKLADRDADRTIAVVDGADVKGLDTEIKKLTTDLGAKQQSLDRARNTVKVLETRAPDLDEQVQSGAQMLQQDMGIFSGEVLERLRAEMLEKVKPLQGVFASLRALNAVGESSVRDLLDNAFLPDPKGYITVRPGGTAWMNGGTNLLAIEPEAEYAEPARAIRTALAPVLASIAAAKALGKYTPLDRRPKPYVRKGYATDNELSRNAAAARAKAEEGGATPTGPKPLPPSEGFKRKTHSDGTYIDGEMGHQVVNNMMRSTSGGSEFAP